MAYKVAIFSLNQWALDFAGNTTRIIESIRLAHEAGAVYRAGPELELCGYSVEDGFYDTDTVFHSWQCLLKIMETTTTMEMVVDVGMPVQNGSLYNCRVIIYKGQILAIRAKTSLAMEGNYRESRYFTPLQRGSPMSFYYLPQEIATKLGQEKVPFASNDFILELARANNNSEPIKIGWEICQELWDSQNISSQLYEERGCHVIFNGSASYWELRKLKTVTNMVKGISLRGGACYAFSNLIGCDGQRTVFYGRSCIYDRGQLVAMTPTCSKIFSEIQMITHIILPELINEYRAQCRIITKPPPLNEGYKIRVQLGKSTTNVETSPKHDILPVIGMSPEGEITLYVSLWLWDYLRRSKMKGFMMPLSGGLDSSSVAMLVYSMCHHISSQKHLEEVKEYFRSVHSLNEANLQTNLSSPEKICSILLKCCYLSTRYSSSETLHRAKSLSKAIGADFVDLSLQDIYTSFRSLLRGQEQKSDDHVTLLDQNLQARLRMVATYFLSDGKRIVLATGNVDEGLMGYLTKYDCSSADINPIGGLCKEDLKSYLRYCCAHLHANSSDLVETLQEILEAPPSAELTGAEQRDEDEIGLTYSEISVLGKVRKGSFGSSGPRGAFKRIWECRHEEPFKTKIRCLASTSTTKSPGQLAEELAELVKRFYLRYARNRHKCTVLTPALHAETYSPDDNRFDHRQFLYPAWHEQFKSIDSMVEAIKKGMD